jgi:hypothetical protein
MGNHMPLRVRRPARKVLALIALVGTCGLSVTTRATEVWFAPDSDTSDFLDLFRKPSLWSRARSEVSVIKLGPQQVGGANQTGKNTLADLSNVDVFRLLAQWQIKLAIEAPAIKPWDCTGRNAAKRTLQFVSNIRKAGGTVHYASMDEPLASGISFCGDTLHSSAVKTAEYMREVARNEPALQIGDIEAYPVYRIDQITQWITALKANGVRPAHFHLDVNIHRLDVSPNIDLAADLESLKAFLHEENIPFGIILWSGYNPAPSDKAYFDRAMAWARRVQATVGPPDQIIFQSWVLRSSPRCVDTDPKCFPQELRCTLQDPPGCGQKDVPINLPEGATSVFSHTRLINEALGILKRR